MEYQILAIGLKQAQFSYCRDHFAKAHTTMRNAISIPEATHILKEEKTNLLVLDMEYLRSIGQSEWITNIRFVSFVPIVVLSDIPEADVGPVIKAGADVCYGNNLPPSVITPLISAQLRRYTEYNHFHDPETAPFQLGDIGIDPARRLVWVRGREVTLRPREFSMLLYFMQNPGIVLSAEEISEKAWGVVGNYSHGISHPIRLLRQAIEPDPANPIYIKTKHRVGYYFDKQSRNLRF